MLMTPTAVAFSRVSDVREAGFERLRSRRTDLADFHGTIELCVVVGSRPRCGESIKGTVGHETPGGGTWHATNSVIGTSSMLVDDTGDLTVDSASRLAGSTEATAPGRRKRATESPVDASTNSRRSPSPMTHQSSSDSEVPEISSQRLRNLVSAPSESRRRRFDGLRVDTWSCLRPPILRPPSTPQTPDPVAATAVMGGASILL